MSDGFPRGGKKYKPNSYRRISKLNKKTNSRSNLTDKVQKIKLKSKISNPILNFINQIMQRISKKSYGTIWTLFLRSQHYNYRIAMQGLTALSKILQTIHSHNLSIWGKSYQIARLNLQVEIRSRKVDGMVQPNL